MIYKIQEKYQTVCQYYIIYIVTLYDNLKYIIFCTNKIIFLK